MSTSTSRHAAPPPAIAALPPASLQELTVTATDPDAELLRLGREFAEARKHYLSLTEPYYSVVGGPPPEVDAQIWPAVCKQHAIAEEMSDLIATTPAGLRAKAEVLMHYVQRDSDGDIYWTNHDDLLGWSIARDLLGRDGE